MRVFALPVVRTQYTSLGTFCSSFFKDIPCILSKFIHYKLSIITYILDAKDTSASSERTSNATQQKIAFEKSLDGTLEHGSHVCFQNRFSELAGSVHICVHICTTTICVRDVNIETWLLETCRF